MSSRAQNGTIKILAVITFLLMVGVNAAANILPINGQMTGEVSDSYPNLFAPAGITFVIWGVIYLLLAGYTLYQLGLFRNQADRQHPELLNQVGLYFIISSLANTAWIFAWHYHQIAWSMLLMAIILICLILITQAISNERLSSREQAFVRLPFSVYFGWITVATIANATTLLVSKGFSGLGLSEPIWTVLIILVGLAIAVATMLRFSDIAYGLVIIWAYSGILIKHTSSSGFASAYPMVIATAAASIVVLLIAEAYLLRRLSKLAA